MPLSCLCLVVMLASPTGQATPPAPATPSTGDQSAPAQKSPTPSQPRIDPDDLPVSLDRIQRALARTPMLGYDLDARPVFRVEVFGELPTIEDILGPDYAAGPVPHGSLTHQEFLEMVTPQDVQGYAGFSSGQAASVAVTSAVFQWTLQRAIQTFNETRDAGARAAARQEVLDALLALEAARAKAGL
jgi:hypothetical protein